MAGEVARLRDGDRYFTACGDWIGRRPSLGAVRTPIVILLDWFGRLYAYGIFGVLAWIGLAPAWAECSRITASLPYALCVRPPTRGQRAAEGGDDGGYGARALPDAA